jgi:hypothetical protein
MPRKQGKALATSLCRESRQGPPHTTIEGAGKLLCVEFSSWSDIESGFVAAATEARGSSRIIIELK